MNSKTYSLFLLAAILSLGFSLNMGTVFAGDDEYEEGSDESYEVQQSTEIKQDCDQSNENEDSSDAVLTNGQACTALGLNLNDIVIEIPIAG